MKDTCFGLFEIGMKTIITTHKVNIYPLYTQKSPTFAAVKRLQ